MNAHFSRKLWDVLRPKSKVDKYSKKVYNKNVIKRKERKKKYEYCEFS